ncbi:MAG: hypothetical protein M3Y27_28375, partial [Acidobacteriota bacterium]|nr:hypothetical protein [Acidobacteriota bacterium]
RRTNRVRRLSVLGLGWDLVSAAEHDVAFVDGESVADFISDLASMPPATTKLFGVGRGNEKR